MKVSRNSQVNKTKSKDEQSCCEPALCCPSLQQEKTQVNPTSPASASVSGSLAAPVSVSTHLDWADKWSHIKVRWGFGRMKSKVDPGIYAVGNPDEDSIVLVSANYKLSFDTLRKELTGLDAWILVLDTKGINVWCAAGKGTFGTDELVNRIEVTGIKEIVRHRTLIVPQLGAPGVSAHEVKQRSSFSIIYGPVRASDIPAFLQAGKKATPEIRRVRFSLWDRMKVVPVELTQGFSKLFLIMVVFFLLSGLDSKGYSINAAATAGIRAVLLLLWAFIAGTVAGPLLLPWLPGRSFSFKGFAAGILFFGISLPVILPGISLIEIFAWFLLISTISSFLTMNFTGASTYTSLSGVKKEMRFAVPAQLAAAVIGCLLWLVGRFF